MRKQSTFEYKENDFRGLFPNPYDADASSIVNGYLSESKIATSSSTTSAYKVIKDNTGLPPRPTGAQLKIRLQSALTEREKILSDTTSTSRSMSSASERAADCHTKMK